MRDLYLQVAQNPAVPCPVHLVEKAYRWADKLAAKTGCGPINRTKPPADIQTAIAELETLLLWCESLTRSAAA
jgi:hypothetical protein